MNPDDWNQRVFFKKKNKFSIETGRRRTSAGQQNKQRAEWIWELLIGGIYALTQAWCVCVCACGRARARVCLC